MIIILGSRLFRRAEFDSENELETVVQSRFDVIFSEDVIYIPQTTIQTPGGVGSIPEAIAIDLSAEKWYIIEVELASHKVWDHIAPQVQKHMVAANNPDMKRKIKRIILKTIEASEGLRKKLADKGIPEIRIHEFIEEMLDKDPVIVIPIDKKPTDIDEWANDLKRDVVTMIIEKYVEIGGKEVAYLVTADRLLASPKPPDEEKAIGRPITEVEYLRQCDEPGQIVYKRLKEFAKEMKHELKPSTQSFSYYVIWKGGKFCPLVIWPKGVTIMKWNINNKMGKIPQAISKFREEIMRIGNLENKYDTQSEPGFSTREGDLSGYDIDLFVEAFKSLIGSIT